MPEIERNGFFILHNSALGNVSVHDHSFLELSYFVNGKAEHTLDGKTDILVPGDYLLIDYGSMHSYSALDGGTFENIDCLFLPTFIDPVLGRDDRISDVLMHYLLNFNMQALSANPTHMVFHDSDGSVYRLIENIRRENGQKLPGYTELIRCYLIEILVRTVRGIEGARIAGEGDDICAFVTSYIRDNYASEVSLSYFSEKLNYSLPYISKVFKERMGMTYLAYLQKYRITRACRLFSTTELSVAEVAESVGYTDAKHFSALFCRIVGVSPAKFRKTVRGR